MTTEKKLEQAQKALQIIAEPVKYLAALSQKEGNKLDSMKIAQMANNPIWLSLIAKETLEDINHNEHDPTNSYKTP